MATKTRNKAEYLLSLVKRNDHQELKKEILQEDGTLKEGVEELTCTTHIGEEETLLVCSMHTSTYLVCFIAIVVYLSRQVKPSPIAISNSLSIGRLLHQIPLPKLFSCGGEYSCIIPLHYAYNFTEW